MSLTSILGQAYDLLNPFTEDHSPSTDLGTETPSPQGESDSSSSYNNNTPHLPVLLGGWASNLACATKDKPSDSSNSTTSIVDLDGDGYGSDEDCNDSDATIHPDKDEVCDGIDNNCDDVIDEGSAIDASTWYADTDGDGYGNVDDSKTSCVQPDGYVDDKDDCDDADDKIHPGAEESDCTDPVDYNCDGSVGYADSDGDGVAACEDCDDTNALAFPGNPEVCDGVDNDCDGTADQEATNGVPVYLDTDSDGYGQTDASKVSCDPSSDTGYSLTSGDCDDTTSAVSPVAPEICNGIDDDCDGVLDNGLSFSNYYADLDTDGYGDPATLTSACEAPAGLISDDTDCDDANAAVNPAVVEACDNVDNNCDGVIDEGTVCATPEVCDGVDNDLDGVVDNGVLSTFYADADSDGFGDATNTTQSCDVPVGFTADSSDCDDTADTVNPDASETCNGEDDNCNGLVDDNATDVLNWYADLDGDTYGDLSSVIASCEAPAGSIADSADCDDTKATVNPLGTEVCDAANTDEDCDGLADDADPSVTGQKTWSADNDVDGYGDPATSVLACDSIPGTVDNDEDCDDAVPEIYPGAPETCNGIDDDCDGVIDNDTPGDTFYADADGDGYGDSATSTTSCNQPVGYVTDASDCDDTTALTNPVASEICDGNDNTCDGVVDEGVTSALYYDGDNDGYGDPSLSLTACETTGYVADSTDCDDGNPSINPGAQEPDCTDPTDYNCDGSTGFNDLDNDGTAACDDCDDQNASVYPAATETCNLLDDNCDGTVDENTAVDVLTWYADTDADGYGDAALVAESCLVPVGYVSDKTDCNDAVASISPAGVEVCDVSNTDEDCDGAADNADPSSTGTHDYYADTDRDGYGAGTTVAYCDPVSGFVATDTDCDDSARAISPAATEVCDSLITDEDCDGVADDSDPSVTGTTTWYRDNDLDGYGSTATTEACLLPSGYASNSNDCDDLETGANPGASELCSTPFDDNCDGVTNENTASDARTFYADNDNDTYGDPSVTTLACDAPALYVENSEDCDDTHDTVNPDAVEICFNVADDNCDDAEIPCTASLSSTAAVDGIYRGFSTDVDGDGYDDGDQAGSSVGSAGDQSGDGLLDVLVGSPNYSVSGGTAFVGAVQVVSNMMSGEVGPSAFATLYGPVQYDFTGFAVSSSEFDFNHDGSPDFLVGAYGNDDTANSAGAAYVVTGPVAAGDQLITTAAGVRLFGATASDEAGYSVSSAGDTDNDNYDDVLVGAPLQDSGGTNAGAAFLVRGSSTLAGNITLSAADATFVGENANDNAGHSVAGVGDVNADGFDDVMVGAFRADVGGTDSGAAYLCYGPFSGTIDLSLCASFYGSGNYYYAGQSVAAAGDINSDGFDDMVVGAYGVDNGSTTASGAALVIKGSSTALGGGSLSSADVTLHGSGAGAYAGYAVAGRGDTNDDGFDDVVVGAFGTNGFAGATYVWFGAASVGGSVDLTDHCTINGEVGNDYSGSAVGLMDVDQDLLGDVVVGASGNATAGTDAGAAYMVLGSSF